MKTAEEIAEYWLSKWKQQDEQKQKSMICPVTPPPTGGPHTGRVLIGVVTCNQPAYTVKAFTQWVTWGVQAHLRRNCDVKFFTGSDLNAPDDYDHIKEKFLALVKWAYEQGYSYLWRVDDDVYLRPERLLAVGAYDYAGPNPYWTTKERTGPFSGFSRKAMAVLLEPDRHPVIRHDDDWMAPQLADKGIIPFNLMPWCGWTHCHGLIEVPPLFGGGCYDWVPTPDNAAIASWEHTGPQMLKIHEAFKRQLIV